MGTVKVNRKFCALLGSAVYASIEKLCSVATLVAWMELEIRGRFVINEYYFPNPKKKNGSDFEHPKKSRLFQKSKSTRSEKSSSRLKSGIFPSMPAGSISIPPLHLFKEK